MLAAVPWLAERICGLDPRGVFRRHGRGAPFLILWGKMAMEARKARLILITTMTSMMVLMVTLVATFTNLGLASNFLAQWMKAYFLAWPARWLTRWGGERKSLRRVPSMDQSSLSGFHGRR